MLEYLQPLLDLFKAEEVVKAGYLVMTTIIFVETGLLIGFCLPGDSLLVTAGIFAASGKLDIITLNLLLIPAAILGDSLGYWIGWKSGPRLFQKEDSLLFKKKHLIAAQEFYEKHGGKTIVIARFMPIVRTFAPVVAGMGKMDYKRFLFFNIFGGAGWVLSMSLTGYFLGLAFPQVAKRLELIIIVVVFVSILPGIIHFLKARTSGKPATIIESLADPEISK